MTVVPPPNAHLLDAIAALYPELSPAQVLSVAAKTDWHARKTLKDTPWLSATLRQARINADLKQTEVAAAMDWSAAKVIRIESGQVGVSHTDLTALIELYRITDPEIVTRLVEEARARRRRVWVQQPNVTAKP